MSVMLKISGSVILVTKTLKILYYLREILLSSVVPGLLVYHAEMTCYLPNKVNIDKAKQVSHDFLKNLYRYKVREK